MSQIRLGDKTFVPYISEQRILESIDLMAVQMNRELESKRPLFLVVLNGAFLFAADLLRRISIDCEVSFIKMASYQGTESTGKVRELIGLNDSLKGRTIVIVEDIIDTGVTLEHIVTQINKLEPAAVYTCALLFKPEAYKKSIPVNYTGIEIPNDFIVGYGLDYNELGRNLRDIYVVASAATQA